MCLNRGKKNDGGLKREEHRGGRGGAGGRDVRVNRCNRSLPAHIYSATPLPHPFQDKQSQIHAKKQLNNQTKRLEEKKALKKNLETKNDTTVRISVRTHGDQYHIHWKQLLCKDKPLSHYKNHMHVA